VNEILIQNKQNRKYLFWFRRDLRLEDNIGLFHALESEYPVIPLFIYDDAILDSLPKNDPRVGFIHESLLNINDQLKQIGSSLLVKKENSCI
jgi:deoxyribodipyrimidine photo-lyase